MLRYVRALRYACVIVCAFPSTLANEQAVTKRPPMYTLEAANLYELGVTHGQQAADRIKGWLRQDEMTSIMAFASGDGKNLFEQLKADNSAAYPHYVEELRGIAEGAGVSMDSIWATNLISEMEGAMPAAGKEGGHCSDIYAISSSGYKSGFAHGHNEDWGGAVKDYWYFTKYVPHGENANFVRCAGMVYPGMILGWAATWNDKGMYLTQNSLFPSAGPLGGVGSVFAQRDAICGLGGERGLDAFVRALTSRAWNYGASINFVDLHARRMANVEMNQDGHFMREVTETMGNYSHFNLYKNMPNFNVPGDRHRDSTVHRQARVDALPPSRSRDEIITRLSDSEDESFPVYRGETLLTAILDGASGNLTFWCCGNRATTAGAFAYSWDILNFWGSPSSSVDKLVISI